MEIGLSDRERDILVELVDDEIGDVREELHHAQAPDAKEFFRDKEVTMKRLRAKLEGKELHEPIVT